MHPEALIMSTSRNPAGRPAVWGPRTAKNFHVPDRLLDLLRQRAAESSMSLSEYAVRAMAESQGFDLLSGTVRNTEPDRMAS